jgi:xylulokinase
MILAADLGTGALKAGLLTAEGRLLARVGVRYPHPPGLGRDDFDPRQWVDAFSAALRQLPPARVTAVALSGNGPTLVPCNGNGEPQADADLWLHLRSVRVEGTSSYYLPKAQWLKTHDHGTWKNTSVLVSCPEWLQYILTGRMTMTLPHEGFRRYIWDSEQIAAYGLEPSLFPEMAPMGTVAGYVHPEAAARFGLPEQIPVVACGSDFMTALLGSGAVEPGAVCDRAGSSEGINYCSLRPAGDARLRDLPHVIEPYWNTAAILSSTGMVFEWYRRLTGQEGKTYEETLSEVESVPPGQAAPLFFPGTRGENLWEFGGGSFHHLEPGHGRSEMGRAVMEAIGFAVRRGIEVLGEAGKSVSEMRVTGGQARGRVWNQMKADITGCRLLIPEIEDAELTGCACCASAALGRHETFLDAARSFVRIDREFEPDPSRLSLYDDAYGRYREATARLT